MEMEKGSPRGHKIPAESTETTDPTPHSRVAQYMRMSTENQQHSIEHQSDIIRQYVESRNMEIVDTYIETQRFK